MLEFFAMIGVAERPFRRRSKRRYESAHTDNAMSFLLEKYLWANSAIYNNLLSAKIAVMLPVEDVGNGSGFMFVVVPIKELLNLLRAHKVSLEARDERQIAEKAAWSSIGSMSWLLAKLALRELRIFSGVRHARVAAAVIPLWLDNRQDGDTVYHFVMSADCQLVAKCITHLGEGEVGHCTDHFEMKCTNIIAILLGESFVAWIHGQLDRG
jgi:hypothetical protein